MKVIVKTPTRLHFGLLNPIEESARKYGSVGLSIEKGGYELEVERSEELSIESPQGQEKRIRDVAQKIRDVYNLSTDFKIKANDTIPTHVGLGSTTQLILGLGKAMTILAGEDKDPIQIAKDTDRGERSGIGTYAFDRGGFIVEGGGEGEFPPLIVRHDFPEDWHILISIPDVEKGPEEEGEGEFFEGLGTEAKIGEKICYFLVLEMLPALVSQNISNFGNSLTKIDELAGKAFSSQQEGMFKENSVSQIRNFLLENGAYGAGQSSWGPTIYSIAGDREKTNELREKLTTFLDNKSIPAEVFISKPNNSGAEIRIEE